MLAFACASTPSRAPRSVAARVETAVTQPARDDIVELDAGVLVYDIAISDTAQIFHIADQLSLWSPFSHRQYLRWADESHVLGGEQLVALFAHKAVRRRLRYGVLDHDFYTTLSVDEALTVASRNLSRDDLVTERELFRTMAPALGPLLHERRASVVAVRDRIVERRDGLAKILRALADFTETNAPKTHVPLWLVATPKDEGGGGGYNGGQMVVEASSDAVEVLLHESLHFVLHPATDTLERAAEKCGAALDEMTLEEGIAYALYPGMMGEKNALEDQLASFAKSGRDAGDAYVRFYRLGLALRPLLETALAQRTTLPAFLPQACASWKTVAATPWP